MSRGAVAAFRGGADLIRVVGHRGARGILPENSMIGFEFAISAGAPLLELDVIMTADMVPVITHNHRLHRPTFRAPDGRFLVDSPKVADLTWAEMQTYEIGRIDGSTAYGQRFPDQAQLDGVRVPRLQELTSLLRRPGYAHVNLMLEIKSDPEFAGDADYRAKLVAAVLADVRSAGVEDRALLHSFDWNLLAECKRQAPQMPLSFLTQLPQGKAETAEESSQSVSPDFNGREGRIPDLVAEAGGAVWCPAYSDITPETAQRAKELGLVIGVWTVNERADIDRMIDLQVDAIVTDYPGRVQRCLSDRGIRWQDAD